MCVKVLVVVWLILLLGEVNSECEMSLWVFLCVVGDEDKFVFERGVDVCYV